MPFTRDFSHTAQKLLEIATSRFHRNLETAKLRHQECTHHWPVDRITAAPSDSSSLPLLCPGLFSPIQTASNCSLHRNQNFQKEWACGIAKGLFPIFMSSKSSSHHSIHHNSNHHQTKFKLVDGTVCNTSIKICWKNLLMRMKSGC